MQKIAAETTKSQATLAPIYCFSQFDIQVRNIPNKYTQRMLVLLFKSQGFDKTFDFLYLPVDFNTRLNVGYCFVNFTKPRYAQQFAKRFHGANLPQFKYLEF